MKNKQMKSFFLCAFLTAGTLNLHAQEKTPTEIQPQNPTETRPQETPTQEFLEPVVITIGKKNEMFARKNALINAKRLSAFYFEKNGMDPADYKINRYFVSIIPKGGGSPSLQMDCYTDVFHEKVIDALKAAPPGSKISFTNIKASSANPKNQSIGLMPDMQLTLKAD
jgi:hypothetical protein